MLTRLPVPFASRLNFAEESVAASAVFFPLVGLFFGLAVWAAALGGIRLNLGHELTAFAVVALPYILNRFFHFDGLCDVLDAFLTDRTRVERLAIMKDSRVGSFALGGAILLLLLKWILAVQLLGGPFGITALLIVPVFARTVIVLLAFTSIYPRGAGLGKAIVGRLSAARVVLALLLWAVLTALWACVFRFPWLGALAAAGLTAAFTFGWRAAAYRKIGGVTGDVLGAGSELAEVVLMLFWVLVMRWHWLGL